MDDQKSDSVLGENDTPNRPKTNYKTERVVGQVYVKINKDD